jgi:hypothetical protein
MHNERIKTMTQTTHTPGEFCPLDNHGYTDCARCDGTTCTAADREWRDHHDENAREYNAGF